VKSESSRSICERHNKTHKCVRAVFKDLYVELGGVA